MNRGKRPGRRNKVSTDHLHQVTEKETVTESELSPKIRKTSRVRAHKMPLTVEQKTIAIKPADPRSKERKAAFEVVEKIPTISVCENVGENELTSTAAVDGGELAISSIKRPRDEAKIKENEIRRSKEQVKRPPTETSEDFRNILTLPVAESRHKIPKPLGSACNSNSNKRIAHLQPEAREIKRSYSDTDITDFLDNLNCQLRETGRDEILLTDFLSCFKEPNGSPGNPATESIEGKPSGSARNKNSSKRIAQLEAHKIRSESSYYQMDAGSFYDKLNSHLRRTGRPTVLLVEIMSCFMDPNEKDIVRYMRGPGKPSTE